MDPWPWGPDKSVQLFTNAGALTLPAVGTGGREAERSSPASVEPRLSAHFTSVDLVSRFEENRI